MVVPAFIDDLVEPFEHNWQSLVCLIVPYQRPSTDLYTLVSEVVASVARLPFDVTYISARSGITVSCTLHL